MPLEHAPPDFHSQPNNFSNFAMLLRTVLNHYTSDFKPIEIEWLNNFCFLDAYQNINGGLSGIHAILSLYTALSGLKILSFTVPSKVSYFLLVCWSDLSSFCGLTLFRSLYHVLHYVQMALFYMILVFPVVVCVACSYWASFISFENKLRFKSCIQKFQGLCKDVTYNSWFPPHYTICPICILVCTFRLLIVFLPSTHSTGTINPKVQI